MKVLTLICFLQFLLPQMTFGGDSQPDHFALAVDDLIMALKSLPPEASTVSDIYVINTAKTVGKNAGILREIELRFRSGKLDLETLNLLAKYNIL